MDRADLRRALAVGGIGFGAQVFQVLAIREVLGLVEGSEVAVGVSLAGWLLGGAAGTLAGRKAAARSADPERLLAFAAPAAALLGAAAVLAVRLSRWSLPLAPGQPPGIGTGLLLAAVGGFLPAVGFGFAFPAAARLLGGARAFAVEAVGALAGGLLFTFLLAPFVPPAGIAALLLALAGAVGLAVDPRPAAAALVLGVAGVVAGPALERTSRAAAYAAFLPGHTLLATSQSARGPLDVLGLRGQVSLYRYGHLDFTSPDPEGAALKAHLALTLCPDPTLVLLSGGGPGVVREALLHPGAQIQYAETDPGALAAMEPWLAPEDRAGDADRRLLVLDRDLRAVLRLSPFTIKAPHYALVAVFGAEPATAAGNRFFTEEFFALAATRTGLLVLSLPGRGEYLPDDLLQRNALVVAAVRKSFAHVAVVPGEAGFLVASRTDPTRLDPAELEARFRERGIVSQGFRPEHFHLLLPEGDAEALAKRLDDAAADLGGERNTDARPAAYFRTFLLRAREGGLRLDILGSPAALAVLAAALLALAALAGARGGPGAASVGTTGFAGLGLAVMVFLGTQYARGDLYLELGLLAALFMAGIAVGARRRGDRLRDLDLATATLCAVAPFATWAPVAWFAVVLATGWCTGATFPAAAAAGGEATRLYAIDLIAAALGALLVGTVLLPAAGAFATGVLLAVLKILAALGPWNRPRHCPPQPPLPTSPA